MRAAWLLPIVLVACRESKAPGPSSDPSQLVDVETPRYRVAVPAGWTLRKFGDTVEATTADAEVRVRLLVSHAKTPDALAAEQKAAIAQQHAIVAQSTRLDPPSARITYEGPRAVGGGSAGMPQSGARWRWVETCLVGDETSACFECGAEVAGFEAACRAYDAMAERFRWK
jgi:hypothetical protein